MCGRGDSVKITTIWMAEADIDSFASANGIVWKD